MLPEKHGCWGRRVSVTLSCCLNAYAKAWLPSAAGIPEIKPYRRMRHAISMDKGGERSRLTGIR
jgi:hypothetical protein